MHSIKFTRRLLSTLLSVLMFPTLATAKQPNIVLFLADDYSMTESSPYGAQEIFTPTMQRLSDEGLTFDQAFVVSPSCAPSRAALLTGLMPARNGAEPNHARPHKHLKKWPAYFQELGYRVVAFGKVSHYEHTADYGFDEFAHDKFHDHEGIPAAVRYLENHARDSTQPLCMLVGSNWPHVPWPKLETGDAPTTTPLPPTSIDTKETRTWRAMYLKAVDLLDKDLQTIYEASTRLLGEDVLFTFTSDHGTQWPFGKWNLYDAGVRVPLIVRWKGQVQAARTKAMVSWVDLLPTLLEAAGGTPPKDLDGKSFLATLREPATPLRKEVFLTHTGDQRWNVYPMRGMRTAEWKYIWNLHPEYAFTTHIDLPGKLGQRGFFESWERAARKDSKAAAILKRYHQRPAEELYNLASDPDELVNLAGDPGQQQRLQEMSAAVKEWMRSSDDQTTRSAEPRLLSDPSTYGPGAAALATE